MERKEISLEQLNERIRKHGPEVGLANVKVSGTVVIKDQEGNIKGEMQVKSLENEDI